MAVTINNWFGRLGNNILQISSALNICLENHSNLFFPNNYHFEKDEIILFDNDKFEQDGVYWDRYIPDNLRRQISKKHILPIIKKNKIDLNNDDLVIHLRGGDVFKHPPNRYVQAPTSYIDYVIRKENPKRIFVVHEDNLNPNLEFIEKNFTNVYNITDILDSVSYILSAKKLVITGIGTFSRCLSMCSNEIKKIYVPSFLKSYDEFQSEMRNWGVSIEFEPISEFYHSDYFIDFDDIEIEKIPIKNYLKIGNWQWNEDIKNLFVNHTLLINN